MKRILGLICLSCFFLSLAEALPQNMDGNSENPSKQEKLNALPQKENSPKEEITKRERRGPLFEALSSALKKNKEILAAQNEIKAFHESHVSATSAFRPKVGFETSYNAANRDQWGKVSGEESKGKVKNRERSYGFIVDQNLFNGFADLAALKEVDLAIKARWSAYEARKQNILAEVAITYFRIIAKKEEIRHLKALLDARRESIGVAEEMYKTGAAKYLDLSQTHASYAETEAKLASAEADYVAHCARFEEDTGYHVPEVLSYPEKLFDESMTEQQALDIATKYNPSVISAVDSLAAAKAGVKKINTELTPSLSARYRFDQSYDNGENNGRSYKNVRGHSIGLTLSVPIYDGGKSRAERRQSIEQATKSAIDKEKVILDVKSQIYAVWAALRAAKQSLISAESAVQARELALHDTEEEYRAGVKIIKDVLDAQEQLFEAKSMKTNAENEYFANQCRAIALIGRMNSHYLMIPGDGFDYKAHFGRTRAKI